MPKTNQFGFAPILLIILLTVLIVGGGATYYSQKRVNLKEIPKQERFNSTNPPEVYQEIKKPGIIAPIPKAELAKESVNLKTQGTEISGLPTINFFPPAGWKKQPPKGNDVIIFEAPQKDYVYSGELDAWTIARINVNVTRAQTNDLEAATRQYQAENKDIVPTTYIFEQKTLFAGQEAYYLEADHDLRSAMRPQIEEEIQKSGKNVSQSDLAKVMEAYRTRSAVYFLQKNGYDVAISGVASAKFWDQRGAEIKKSISSLIFIGQ